MPLQRDVQDATLKSTKALPAAGANNSHDGIDLGNTAPGGGVEQAELVVAVPATPALANGISITFTPQDSADNATFAAIAGLGARTTTGAGGVGAPATNLRWPIPLGVRRYVRINQAVGATGGDNTAVSPVVSVRV